MALLASQVVIAGLVAAELSASSDLGAGWVMGLSQSVAALGQLFGPALGILAVSLGAPIFFVGTAVVALLGAVAIRGSGRDGTRA